VKLAGQRVLLISPEDWGGCWLSKHHYASVLAERGNTVFFLGPCLFKDPPSNLPSNVVLLDNPRIPKGLRHYPRAIRHSVHRKLGAQLRRQAGGDFDLVWTFDPCRMFDLDQVCPSSRRLFYLADIFEKCPWPLLARSAQLCLGCSGEILEGLRLHNPNSHFINHGFIEYPTTPYDFGTPGKNVVYAGNLAAKHLDVQRVARLLDAYKDVNFHFFGDDGTGNLAQGRVLSPLVQLLQARPNAHLRGTVSPRELASIYVAADVLLLFYDPFDGVVVWNTHKMMEYLASGTPILATRVRAYDDIADTLQMHDSVDDYVGALGALLDGEMAGLSERRVQYARKNSYSSHLERIEGLLKAVSNPHPG
jgi:glycosyltransferase involved in cell wall biosynthesis